MKLQPETFDMILISPNQEEGTQLATEQVHNGKSVLMLNIRPEEVASLIHSGKDLSHHAFFPDENDSLPTYERTRLQLTLPDESTSANSVQALYTITALTEKAPLLLSLEEPDHSHPHLERELHMRSRMLKRNLRPRIKRVEETVEVEQDNTPSFRKREMELRKKLTRSQTRKPPARLKNHDPLEQFKHKSKEEPSSHAEELQHTNSLRHRQHSSVIHMDEKRSHRRQHEESPPVSPTSPTPLSESILPKREGQRGKVVWEEGRSEAENKSAKKARRSKENPPPIQREPRQESIRKPPPLKKAQESSLKRDSIEVEDPFGYNAHEDYSDPFDRESSMSQEKRKVALRGLHSLINNLG
ncbi:hypothetical protein [Mechercharimyces sp. CAU 1602]|uniref:hypothetical protein n=1 Tax=Mechercharimyces sp. CAU 1602 TaxID=2973933 RepID=UPI002163D38E|nr:hypothetical protein [Mechercharimyces sp. CAU 1602]MCS1352691.1 hypothetical protein [Mechercharimyces sp. CAU 1602]